MSARPVLTNCTFRTIESVFELLIEWAEAGFEHSANQPVLPAAFIVLNAVAVSTPEYSILIGRRLSLVNTVEIIGR